MTPRTSPRQTTLDALAERYGDYMTESYGEPFKLHEDQGFYVLVELSAHTGQHYVTQHEDPASAAQYRDCSESPEDWTVQHFVRVRIDGTLLTYDMEVKTTFTPCGGGPDTDGISLEDL